MKVVIVQFTLLFASAALCAPQSDPVVVTNRGQIKGLQGTDGDYNMYLGIPYAKVNETNPFGPSIAYPDFEEAFEAYDDTGKCPQIDEFAKAFDGSLDCLHLNIYVPNIASTTNQLPVLVWIYGGGFQIGYHGRKLYGPKFLVRHDILLVTINYRVGPYGFMCLDTPDVPGNQGLKDQLAALRWINENIAAFGGDPDQVTIFGESAGGVSVDFHLLSAQETLFQRAILQSGTSFCPWAIIESKPELPITMAATLGYETDDVATALSYLTESGPESVISAITKIALKLRGCVEQEFDGVERFIPEHPVNSAVPKAQTIPILIGHNSDEMLAAYGNKKEADLSLKVFSSYLNTLFNFTEVTEMETLVRRFYMGDEDLSIDVKQQLTDFESDMYISYAVQRGVQKFLATTDNVYHYVFSYTGDRNFVRKKNNITTGGAAHADEIGYLFDGTFFTDTPSDADQLIIDRMTTMWANFVKYGDPTPETSDLLPVQWVKATTDVLYYLDIDTDMSIKRRPFNERVAFWDLFFKANKANLRYYNGE